MDPRVEEKRVVVEIIATLVNIKSTMVEIILRPAGVTPDIYQPLLSKREESTGRLLSKRQIAPFIIEAIDECSDGSDMVRKIIEIAAGWNSFHLAHDEFAARATVQKAREVLGQMELMEERETKQRELGRKEELARLDREWNESRRKQSELLLMMFDDLVVSDNAQRRGYLLQDLLNLSFDLHQIPVVRSFTRNKGAEQIDGAFKLGDWYYIVECRWRERLADIRQLDGLKGQVDRSGKQTMGMFLSINGWSENVPPLLKQNPEKSIILMDGFDLRSVLDGQADLRNFLQAKLAHLNLEAEPLLSVKQYLNDVRG